MTNIAIQVKNVNKTFRIPHEKINTMRGAFVNILKKKTYEKFKALDDISFEVKKGEFFGIIGRNGSGKSTLLKILASIYQPDGGRIKISGLISPFLELGIGFNPELSGRDNIYLNGTVLGLSRKQIDKKFNDIVQFSELEKFIDQKLKNYSSGMSVRLAFSVAIHANRDILLMDEVLAVGDSNFQSKCLEEFNKYKDLGKTVILVTHDIATVQKYCDQAMLLRNGKIEIIGDPEKVGNRYVYQNMSDEEKRIYDEEKRIKEKTEKELEERKVKEEKGKANKKVEEEKSLATPDPAKPEKPKKKIAEITKVEFLDKDGKVRNIFETGEDMAIKIYFRKNKDIKDLSFRVSMEDDLGFYIFGYDTNSDKYKFTKKECVLNFYVKKAPFLKGIYYINVSCFSNNGSKEIDFKPKIKDCSFFSPFHLSNYKGVINIKHEWE